jgi:hypothetical protein
MPTESVKDGNDSLTSAHLLELESRSLAVDVPRKSRFNNFFRLTDNKSQDIGGSSGKKRQKLNWSATLFISAQVVVGLPLLPYALLHWHPQSELRFICFFVVALAASVFKVRLPGIEATMSANFLFILVGILDLSHPETLLMGCLGGLVQSIWQSPAAVYPDLVQFCQSVHLDHSC